MPDIKTLCARLTIGLLLLFALSIPVLVAQHSLTFPFYWNLQLLLDVSYWTFGVLILSALLKFSKSNYSRLALIAILLSYLAVGVGILSSLATIYFIVSSYLFGRLALQLVSNDDLSRTFFDRALLVGIALYICVFSVLIHYPLNSQAFYLFILSTPFFVISNKRFSKKIFSTLYKELKTSSNRLQRTPFWSVAIIVLAVGYIFRFSFFPSISYDDNVLHLRMWAELTKFHQYSFNIENQIWSVAPFALDLLHSIISIASNSDARGALNLAITALLLRALWSISSVLLKEHLDRTIALLLFCSTPILATLLTSLQTELILAFFITSGVKILLENKVADPNSKSLALLAAASLCAATKLPGMVLGIMLLFAYAPLLLRERIHFKATRYHYQIAIYAFLVLALTFSAVQSYIFSWFVSGNPLFPLYNEIFKSPYYAIQNFADPLYQKGFTLQSFWSLFYNTSSYYESRDFVAGFQYLYLLPIGLITLLASKTTSKSIKIALIIPTLGFGLVMFSASQYWRYLFPILPLASVIIAYLLSKSNTTPGSVTGGAWITRLIFLFFIVTNVYFLPGVAWYFFTPTQVVFTKTGKNNVTELVAPSKAITNYLNINTNNPTVLFDPNASYGATLLGKPVYTNWYSPKQTREYESIKTKSDAASLMEQRHIDYVVWNSALANQVNRNAILEFLTTNGQPIHQVGPLILYKLSKEEVHYSPIYNLQDQVASTSNETKAHLLKASATPKVISTIKVDSARSAKYNVEFECSNTNGSFIAQVNWNLPPVYYKLIPCVQGRVSFTETLPIPEGATTGDVYITARDRESVDIIDLSVGVN